nr:MAG TPA: hypothetical protein [Bacteriophage sp.]
MPFAIVFTSFRVCCFIYELIIASCTRLSIYILYKNKTIY